MLKATLAANDNIDIRYPNLTAFLKRENVGYKPKKSEIFTREEVYRFLLEAADERYLMMKVNLV